MELDKDGPVESSNCSFFVNNILTCATAQGGKLVDVGCPPDPEALALVAGAGVAVVLRSVEGEVGTVDEPHVLVLLQGHRCEDEPLRGNAVLLLLWGSKRSAHSDYRERDWASTTESFKVPARMGGCLFC